MDKNNVIPFQPRNKPEPAATRKPGSLTEDDMRWLMAACREFRRLRDEAGEDTITGQHLHNAYAASLVAVCGIGDILGMG